MKVMRDGRRVTVEVTADGDGMAAWQSAVRSVISAPCSGRSRRARRRFG